MKKYYFSLLFVLFATILQAAIFETQKREVGDFTSIRSSSSIDIILEQTGKIAVEVKAPERYLDRIKTEVKAGELNIYIDGSIRYSGEIVVYVQVKDIDKISLHGSGDFMTNGELKTSELTFKVAGSGDFSAQLNAKVVKGNMNGSGDVKISGITESLSIRQSGSGDLIANSLHLLTCKLSMNGSGDSKLSGSTDNFELTQSGSGDFSGRNFEAENVKIRKSSSGDARIIAIKKLEISSHGSGDLYYSGRPQIDIISASGSGDITKIK